MAATAPPASTFTTAPRTEPATVGNFPAQLPNVTRLNATRLREKWRRRATSPGHAGDPATAANPLEHFGTLAGEGHPACVSGGNTRNVSIALNLKSSSHAQTGPGRRANADHPRARLRSQQEHPAHTGHPRMRPSPGHTHPTVQRVRRTGNANVRDGGHPTRELGRHKDGPTVDDNTHATPVDRSRINRENRLRGFGKMTAAEINQHLAPAREGFWKSFEQKADPDGRMTPEERRAAAERLRKAHYSEMARKSAAVRRKKAERRKAIRDAAIKAAEAAILALETEDEINDGTAR